MSRYIDADALLKHFDSAEQIGFGIIETAIVKDFIINEPTADVVEVVRCKDCMWNYIHVTPKGHDYHICKLMNLAFDNNDNFFCAYGEKKNKDAESIPQWRGCIDGCLPYYDGKEAKE